MKSEYQIIMVSESCLLVKFGDTICPAINRKVRKLSDYVEKHPFPGFVETVVSYTGLAVLYDPWAVQKALGRGGGKSFQLVGDKLAEYMEKLAEEHYRCGPFAPDRRHAGEDEQACGGDCRFGAEIRRLCERLPGLSGGGRRL